MKIKFTLLGTGSSMGIPRPDGFFGNCDPKNIKNYRTRCSALISFGDQNILIDTSPDLRQQLLSQKVTFIDYVLYTHLHADQTHGINDLRIFYLKKKNKNSCILRKNYFQISLSKFYILFYQEKRLSTNSIFKVFKEKFYIR